MVNPGIGKLVTFLNYCVNFNLVGKVQVVNTLVASLFVHKMMVLPLIPNKVVKTMDNMVREFLWNGRKAKIALNILQIDKRYGGLNLVNLKNRDKALKASWPQILVQEPEYSKLVYAEMRVSILQENIWRCSLMKEDVSHLKISSDFWKDVLASWCEYNYYYQRRWDNQIIWYNSCIRIGGKPIFWGDLYKRGLVYVYQLFCESGFRELEELQRDYGLTCMRHNSLRLAISLEWKEYFTDLYQYSFLPTPPTNYHILVGEGNRGIAKKVYKYLSEDVLLLHNKYIKWREELVEEFCESLCEYGLLHLDIYKVTNVTKYRSFQYRLNQRAIITNIQLFRWNRMESENCSFCALVPETLTHLLWACPVIQELWRMVFQFFQQELGLCEVKAFSKAVIFNQVVKGRSHVANFLCLVTKQYIYSQRCLGRNIHYPELRAKFRQLQNVEKYIAIKNDKLELYKKKWEKGVRVNVNVDNQNIVLEYLDSIEEEESSRTCAPLLD